MVRQKCDILYCQMNKVTVEIILNVSLIKITTQNNRISGISRFRLELFCCYKKKKKNGENPLIEFIPIHSLIY